MGLCPKFSKMSLSELHTMEAKCIDPIFLMACCHKLRQAIKDRIQEMVYGEEYSQKYIDLNTPNYPMLTKGEFENLKLILKQKKKEANRIEKLRTKCNCT